jgi:hypothetical protein
LRSIREITDDEKVSIALSAGCEMELVPDPENPGKYCLRTRHPVGFYVDEKGQIRVVEKRDSRVAAGA